MLLRFSGKCEATNCGVLIVCQNFQLKCFKETIPKLYFNVCFPLNVVSLLMLLLFEQHNYTVILNMFKLWLICTVIFTCFHSGCPCRCFPLKMKSLLLLLGTLAVFFALKRVSDVLVGLLCAHRLTAGT